VAGTTAIADQDLVERVAQSVLATFSFAVCIPCLATRLGATEKAVRDAAQIVVSRKGFRVARRSCYGCNRRESVLVGEKL
jgi:hypothetical protein